jgi:hypothetical protein
MRLGVFTIILCQTLLRSWLLIFSLRSIFANLSHLNWTCSGVPRDFGVLELVCAAHGLRTLDVHVLVLIAVEALHVMSSEAALGAAHAWHTLHKADHCLLAVGVERTVIARMNVGH